MQLNSLGIHLYKLLQENKKLYIYIPLTLYWVVLFTATSIPGDSLPTFGISDKFKHFGAFFVLAVLLNFAFHFQTKSLFIKLNSFSVTYFVIIFYSLFDEIHQILIPGRYFDWFDLLADLVGGIMGILIVRKIIRLYKRNMVNNPELY